MKKTFVIILALFALVIFFYGAVAALVNQGHGLLNSLLTLVLVGIGAGALIWLMRPDR